MSHVTKHPSATRKVEVNLEDRLRLLTGKVYVTSTVTASTTGFSALEFYDRNGLLVRESGDDAHNARIIKFETGDNKGVQATISDSQGWTANANGVELITVGLPIAPANDDEFGIYEVVTSTSTSITIASADSTEITLASKTVSNMVASFTYAGGTHGRTYPVTITFTGGEGNTHVATVDCEVRA